MMRTIFSFCFILIVALFLLWNNKYVVVAIKGRWDDERGRKWGAWLRYYLSSPQVWASIHIMHSVLLCVRPY